MPFHPHHESAHANANAHAHSPAGALYQAAQALGSIGAPAGSDALLHSSQHSQHSHSHSHSRAASPPASSGLAYQRAPAGAGPGALARNEELHLAAASAQAHPHQHQQYSDGDPYAAPAYAASSTTAAYAASNPPAPASLPGSLQPGGSAHQQQQQHHQQRPAPAPAYTAPATVPTMPQGGQPGTPQAPQYTLPTRSNTMSQQQQPATHAYSRSSPAGMGPEQHKYQMQGPEQQKYQMQDPNPKYIPFSTPTASTPAQKYYPPTPSGAASNSPLGLSDIRPRANSAMNDDAMAGNSSFFGDSERAPSNSNYLAPWAVYAFDWCKWGVQGGNSAGKMAIASYLEDTHNFIQILDTHLSPQESPTPGAPPYGLEYTRVAEATCSYPVTRILWEPPSTHKQSTDLLATSGDHLRLWSLPQTPANTMSNTITRTSSVNTRDPPPQKLTPLALLSNSKTPEHTAPLTSLDWNTQSPKLIITSSIDTTCTIWDIPTLTAKTQLIAHDKEVFDVRFCAASVDVFVSCGADGSVRMFDLRSLEHSTIIYEPSEKALDREKGSPAGGRMSPTKAQQTMSYAPPLLRLAASPHDSHLLATFAADSNLIRILDVRQPGQALLELCGHSAAVNSIEWNPSRRGMLASGGDDSLVLIWDLLHAENAATISTTISGGADIAPGAHQQQQPNTPRSAHPTNGGAAVPTPGGTMGQKGPYASWKCGYEVGNISWAPQSVLTSQGGEWLGVAGGRGVWGVKL